MRTDDEPKPTTPEGASELRAWLGTAGQLYAEGNKNEAAHQLLATVLLLQTIVDPNKETGSVELCLEMIDEAAAAGALRAGLGKASKLFGEGAKCPAACQLLLAVLEYQSVMDADKSQSGSVAICWELMMMLEGMQEGVAPPAWAVSGSKATGRPPPSFAEQWIRTNAAAAMQQLIFTDMSQRQAGDAVAGVLGAQGHSPVTWRTVLAWLEKLHSAEAPLLFLGSYFLVLPEWFNADMQAGLPVEEVRRRVLERLSRQIILLQKNT